MFDVNSNTTRVVESVNPFLELTSDPPFDRMFGPDYNFMEKIQKLGQGNGPIPFTHFVTKLVEQATECPVV
ncbi:hypothetical protein GCM10007968_22890 [Sporolactobacillus putidus]|uniref:Uncharacterized protein n=1 Tax=Sporolactobacillus putidus TaxID=492735 RepID=A0A917W376_9BACL|nr:hypothetical protein GCM10007968_22890 [Sporolactobacillus putidus]